MKKLFWPQDEETEFQDIQECISLHKIQVKPYMEYCVKFWFHIFKIN